MKISALHHRDDRHDDDDDNVTVMIIIDNVKKTSPCQTGYRLRTLLFDVSCRVSEARTLVPLAEQKRAA